MRNSPLESESAPFLSSTTVMVAKGSACPLPWSRTRPVMRPRSCANAGEAAIRDKRRAMTRSGIRVIRVLGRGGPGSILRLDVRGRLGPDPPSVKRFAARFGQRPALGGKPEHECCKIERQARNGGAPRADRQGEEERLGGDGEVVGVAQPAVRTASDERPARKRDHARRPARAETRDRPEPKRFGRERQGG